jgi:NAD(P)-dependent dehydrogenase (short-subunit alcohol dehydrogenase family)
MDLAGRIALVTGSARRVGRAIALALAERGCDLLIHYNNSASEAKAAIEVAQAAGVRAASVQADLTCFNDIQKLYQFLDQTYERLDLLVNSAAIMQPIDLMQVREEDWDRTLDLNLKAPFFCIQLAAERMQQHGGAIVNISDVAGLRPWARYPTHSVSKAGIEMLTGVAARALGPKIRVNAVAPGPVLRSEWMDEQQWQKITRVLPLQRGGNPDDIAEAVIFLFENDFITGETIIVDGGRNLV